LYKDLLLCVPHYENCLFFVRKWLKNNFCFSEKKPTPLPPKTRMVNYVRVDLFFELFFFSFAATPCHYFLFCFVFIVLCLKISETKI